MQTTDVRQRQRQFGETVLGPIITDYLIRLAHTAGHMASTRGARPLFVSRAGVRIKRLLDVYLETAGRPELAGGEIFWTSRLLTAKGTFFKTPDAALAILAKEFKGEPVSAFAEAMLRQSNTDDASLSRLSEVIEGPQSISRFLDSGSPAAVRVTQHFEEQSTLLESYVSSLAEGYESLLLIDSGWQGSAQTLLARSFPDIDWWGAYFGRVAMPDSDRTFWDKMIGIVVEQDQFDPEKPESAIILQRHIIESLFEPAGPSIERLARTTDGTIIAPEATLVLKDNMTIDPFVSGVLDHMSATAANRDLHESAAAAREAWLKLSRFIVHPDKQDIAIYGSVERSLDFGREGSHPVLLPTKDRNQWDSPETRILDSIWQAGQAAAEYPLEMARPIQRKIAGVSRDFIKQSKPTPSKVKIEETDRPSVAVITRTLDRPTFLKRAIASVACQTFHDYVHVIVCDGGDIEPVRDAILNSDCDTSRILLVDNVENRGMEAASNIAIGACDSEFVVIHDDDDSWEPSFLEETVGFLKSARGRKYGGVISKSVYVSEQVTPDGIKIHKKVPYQDWVDRVDLAEMAIGNFFPPIAFVFRRSVYDDVGGYNEAYPVLGDWDFNLRFLLKADIAVLPKPLAFYHHRDVGDTHSFGNSVIADRDKHSEYSAIVRNQFVRDSLSTDRAAAAQLVLMGSHLGELRTRTRAAEHHAFNASKRGGAAPASSVQADPEIIDAYWLAFCQLAKRPGGAISLGLSPFSDPETTFSKLAKRNGALRGSIPIAPDFDEKTYLAENEDVRVALEKGEVSSGYAHYILHGREEGRRRPGLDAEGALASVQRSVK